MRNNFERTNPHWPRRDRLPTRSRGKLYLYICVFVYLYFCICICATQKPRHKCGATRSNGWVPLPHDLILTTANGLWLGDGGNDDDDDQWWWWWWLSEMILKVCSISFTVSADLFKYGFTPTSCSLFLSKVCLCVKGDRKIRIKKKIRLNCFQNLVNCGRWQDCVKWIFLQRVGCWRTRTRGRTYCGVFTLTLGDTALCICICIVVSSH